MAAPGSLPLKGSPEFIAHDFIFSGEMNLEETENLLGGAVLEMKEDFLKKSKSQSSGHSKGWGMMYWCISFCKLCDKD